MGPQVLFIWMPDYLGLFAVQNLTSDTSHATGLEGCFHKSNSFKQEAEQALGGQFPSR